MLEQETWIVIWYGEPLCLWQLSTEDVSTQSQLLHLTGSCHWSI